MTSLSADGVTLLLDGALVRRDLRLAGDLLAAATGRWELEPATRRFDWPPAAAITAAAGDRSAERALRAFVEKELADQASTLLILSRAVEARLAQPRTAGDRLVVADFEALARDPVAKREVWARLGQYRLARARSVAVTGGAEPTAEKTPPLTDPGDAR